MPNIDGNHPSICPSLSGWSVHTTTRWCIVAAHECYSGVGCVKVSANSSRRSFFSLSLSWCYFQVLARRESSWMPHHVHTRIEKKKDRDRRPASAHKHFKKKGEKKNFVIFLMLMRVLTFRSSSSIQKNNFRPFSLSNITYWTLRNSRGVKGAFLFLERSQHTRTDPFYNIAI
jgi:hypothetical protein